MRLTKKTKYGYENESCEITQCSDKLGQLEDIEEEFEIDSIEDLRDRLTKYKFLANHEMSCVDVEAYNLMLKDLNLYHKLEDELGIDLITLFMALKYGVYVKESFSGDTDIKMRSFQICGDNNGITFWAQVKLDIKDYGKTWALTKEELL